eukprot:sb/3467123/
MIGEGSPVPPPDQLSASLELDLELNQPGSMTDKQSDHDSDTDVLSDHSADKGPGSNHDTTENCGNDQSMEMKVSEATREETDVIPFPVSSQPLSDIEKGLMDCIKSGVAKEDTVTVMDISEDSCLAPPTPSERTVDQMGYGAAIQEDGEEGGSIWDDTLPMDTVPDDQPTSQPTVSPSFDFDFLTEILTEDNQPPLKTPSFDLWIFPMILHRPPLSFSVSVFTMLPPISRDPASVKPRLVLFFTHFCSRSAEDLLLLNNREYRAGNAHQLDTDNLPNDMSFQPCQSIGLTHFSDSERELWSEHWPDRSP